jgi:hypothetical protein
MTTRCPARGASQHAVFAAMMAHNGLLAWNRSRECALLVRSARRMGSLRPPDREGAMSLGLILIILVILYLFGGLSGRFGGYGYGLGHSGIGLGGVILVVLLVLVLLGKI